MKKIITSIAFLLSLSSYSQDSSTLKVSATIQARDLEYIAQLIYLREDYEEMWDNMKAKFRVVSPPAGTTNVTVDTVTLQNWNDIHGLLKSDPIAKSVYNRVDAILLALNQSWLTSKINQRDAFFIDRQNALQQFGRNKLRKQNN
jgi:hypothetical protein